MSKYDTLINAIQSVVKTNGNGEITGANMQSILVSIVNTLRPEDGTGFFRGVISTKSIPDPQAGDGDYYIAIESGIYSSFGGATVPAGDMAILTKDGNSYRVAPLGLTEYTFIDKGNFIAPDNLREGYYNQAGDFVASAANWATTQPIAIQPKCRYIVRGRTSAATYVVLLDAGQSVLRTVAGNPDATAFIIETQDNEAFIQVSGVEDLSQTFLSAGLFFDAVLDNPKAGKPEPWTGIVGGKLLFSTDGTTPIFGIFTPTSDKMDFCTTDGDGNRQTTLLSLEANEVTIPVRASFPLGLEQSRAYVGDVNNLVQEGIYYCDTATGATNLPESSGQAVIVVAPYNASQVMQLAHMADKIYRRFINKAGGSGTWLAWWESNDVVKTIDKTVKDDEAKTFQTKDNGSYAYNDGAVGLGVMLHLMTQQGFGKCLQIRGISGNYPALYFRAGVDYGATYTPWYKLQKESTYTAELATYNMPAMLSSVPTEEELKAQLLRSERDNLLRATDKFAISDYPFSSEEEKTAIYQYRQALRDLPQSADFPNVELPTPPEEVIIKKND